MSQTQDDVFVAKALAAAGSPKKKEKKAKKGVPAKEKKKGNDKAGAAVEKKERKKRRKKHAIREIRKLQNSTDPVLAKSSLRRVIRETAHATKPDVRFEKNALYALQEATESFMHDFFTTAMDLVVHRGGITLEEKDTTLVKRMMNYPLTTGSSNRDNY